jgi:hypothetical protein
MKITQLLNYISIIALAILTFSCGSDEETIATTPIIEKVSPSAAFKGNLITVTGTNLESLDSVKLGKIKLNLISTTTKEFTFNVPANAVSAKLFVYKGTLVDSSKSVIVKTFTVTGISPTIATIEETITVTGTMLNDVDSVKLGPVKVILDFERNNTYFTFQTRYNHFTDKLYLYNDGFIDSSLTLSIVEPTGSIINRNGIISCLIDNTSFAAWAVGGIETYNGKSVYTIGTTIINNDQMAMVLPRDLEVNKTYEASQNFPFFYNDSMFDGLDYIANGSNGTSGSFTVTELGSDKSYIRGTFTYKAAASNGKTIKVSNGRLATGLY